MAITAIVGAGVAGAAGSVIAGQEQAGAAKDATQAQLAMYNQTRSDLMPYMTGGNAAFAQVQALLGLNGGSNKQMLQTLRNTPGYQFALKQGEQGLDRSAAARGLQLSGGQMKDSMSFNQGMADQNYNNYYNQLMGVSGLGENAAAQTGNAATATGQGMSQSIMAGGAASASGIAGAANGIGSSLYQYGMMNPSQTGSYDATGTADTGYAGAQTGDNWMLSDRRAKDGVEKIGNLDSGLPVYTFKYRGSQLPQIGVMAQDVERVAPRAVRTGSDGLKRVDYSQLPTMKRAA